MVATAVLDEAQIRITPVMVLPLAFLVTAVYCCALPAARVLLAGEMVMEVAMLLPVLPLVLVPP
jgi:hypothetical protein